MKKPISFTLLFFTAISLSAQQKLPEMGLALRYANNVEGLYATHRTLPFGTTLLITNMLNETQIEVQVGGRPDSNSRALVEISPLACEFLGIPRGVLTQVQVEVVAQPAPATAMRPRLSVEQTGRALAQATGDELTAYHPSIAINTNATLTNTATGQTVIVIIKGRVQASKERIVEISRAAAQALGIRGTGEIHLKTN